jgi:hypothetical protein
MLTMYRMLQKQQHPSSASWSILSILTSLAGLPFCLHHSSSFPLHERLLHETRQQKHATHLDLLYVLESDAGVDLSVDDCLADVHPASHGSIVAGSHAVVLGQLVDLDLCNSRCVRLRSNR